MPNSMEPSAVVAVAVTDAGARSNEMVLID